MTIEDLRFPVVSLSGRTMVSARSERELARGTRTGVKTGYFKKVIVIDSRGNRLKFSGARPQGLANPLLLLAWFMGFPLTLHLENAEVLPPIELGEFKESICAQIDRDRGFWSSVGVGATGLKERVRTAVCFEDVIRLCSRYTVAL